MSATLDRQVEAEKRTVVRYAGYVERGVRPDAQELLERSLQRLDALLTKQRYARMLDSGAAMRRSRR